MILCKSFSITKISISTCVKQIETHAIFWILETVIRNRVVYRCFFYYDFHPYWPPQNHLVFWRIYASVGMWHQWSLRSLRLDRKKQRAHDIRSSWRSCRVEASSFAENSEVRKNQVRKIRWLVEDIKFVALRWLFRGQGSMRKCHGERWSAWFRWDILRMSFFNLLSV